MMAAQTGGDPPLPPDMPVEAPEAGTDGWRRLPPNARRLFVLTGLALAVPPAVGFTILAQVFDVAAPWLAGLAGAVAGGLLGAWHGVKRHRHTGWRLDAEGFSLRKGRLWRTETRVPANRVQHLDLKRGPLERRYGLATLVIHTAGTRDSAVNVEGLRDADAEHLRDRLARQMDHDDDAR